jgi:hypothetical protein
MYRCHFTRNGRIVAGDELDADALEEAIQEAWSKLTGRGRAESVDGFEIWQGAQLLHASIH